MYLCLCKYHKCPRHKAKLHCPIFSQLSALQSAVHAPVLQPVHARSNFASLPALPAAPIVSLGPSMAKQRRHPGPPRAPFKQSQAPGKFTNSVEVQSLASAVPFNPGLSTQQGQVPFPAQSPPLMNNYHRTMLKPMELPKFTGKACDYVRWRQRFLQVVDSSCLESIG